MATMTFSRHDRFVIMIVTVFSIFSCSLAFVRLSTIPGIRHAKAERIPSQWIAKSELNSSLDGLDTEETTNQPTRVGIAGFGAIACGTASILSENGHFPMLWSPSGSRTLVSPCQQDDDQHLTATGALEYSFSPRIAVSAKQLVEENDIILIALPANGHKKVFDEIAPFVCQGQQIIISSHASLGALYLTQLLQQRGITIPPITAWGTTVCTARLGPSGKNNQVRINTLRQSVDLCTVPQEQSQVALDLCRRLFRQVEFRPRDGLLAVSLSNVNPQNHLGIALGNMGRIEKGESWYQLLNITPNIGRFLEALDQERLAIAEELNVDVKTIFDHFHLSFHVPVSDSISDMNQEIHAMGNDVLGPDTADSRYVTEDVPFGLVLTIVLGNLVHRPAILHQAGLQIASAMYGRDFMGENDLLNELGLQQYTLKELKEAAYTGILVKESTTTTTTTTEREAPTKPRNVAKPMVVNK